MRTLRLYALMIAMCISQGSPAFAADKKLTIYQRQVNLMKRINEAQKVKQLTVKQAKGFRKDLSKVAVKKQKIRDKHTGKVGNEDMSNVDERLTEISAKINQTIQANLKDKD